VVLRAAGGGVAESYFSASCGGATADVARLWGAERPPAHLRGVRDDACAAGAWTDVIPAAQLSRALGADERSDVGARLEGVRVVRRDRTGRAELVELVGARRRRLRGWDFKIIVGRTLGWGVLKSSRFEVSRAGSAYVFRGAGFGHGLGLCQAGAHVSAARGAGYRQILGRYFPGAGVGALRNADFGLRIDERGGVGNRPLNVQPPADAEAGRQSFLTASFRPASYGAASFRPASFSGPAHNIEPAHTSGVPDPRSQLRSVHFSLSYPPRVARREAEALLRTLEAAHAELARRLGRASAGVGGVPFIEVSVYETTGDFVGATGQPPWVAAVTEGRRIRLQPLEVLRRRGLLSTTPRHELVHAALEALGAGRAPRWLAEGLAAHFAGEGPALARSAPGARMPTDELERRLARPASAVEMRALYAAAYREVSALVRREGEPAVWRRALR
jgi:hypothetical protein